MAENRRDHRKLDLTKEDDSSHLRAYIENYIQLAKDEMQRVGYADMCAKIALYVEGFQVPVGMKGQPLSEFVRNNIHSFDHSKFQVQKDENNIIFFYDNRLGEMYNGYLAEFVKSKKTLSPEHGSNPRNEKLEWAIKHWMVKWQKKKNFWEQVMVQAIGYMLKFNRSWIRQFYDSFRIYDEDNMGDIGVECFHPCSVLSDPFPLNKFILNSRFVIPFKKIPLYEAQMVVESLGQDPSKLSADNEADEIMYNGKIDIRTQPSEQFCTFYYPEWKQLSLDPYKLKDATQEQVGNMNKSQLKALRSNCFQGIYNTGLGVFWYDTNRYADPRQHDQYQFGCVPLEDEQSDISNLNTSKIGKAIPYQDILNVVLTLYLNDTRQRTLIRGFIDKMLIESWGDAGKTLLKDFINIGAMLPVNFQELGNMDPQKLMSFVTLPDNSAKLQDLLVIIDNVLKRATIKKEVLSGQLPNKTSEQMSGTLAKELKDSNSTLLQPIIQNIEWTAGTLYRYQYNILAEEFGEDEWVEVSDGAKGDPKYIPIAAEWDQKKFNEFLQKQYPDMPLKEAGKKFNEKSEVIVEIDAEKGEAVDPVSQKPIVVYRDKETKAMLTPDEVNKRTKIYVNSLMDRRNGKKHTFDFKVDMVFGVDDSKYEDKVMAAQLFQKNPDSLVLFEIFLEMQGGYWADNKDTILENFKNEKDILKMVSFIQEQGPEFMPILQKFVQQYLMHQKQQEGGGQGGEKPAPEVNQPVAA